MVEIKKGKMKMKVTKSAFENFYEGAGWVIEAEDFVSVYNEVPKEEDVNESENSEDEWADYIEEESEIEKPLSEMNNAELKEKAASLGINVNGLNNKQLRERIKNHSA